MWLSMWGKRDANNKYNEYYELAEKRYNAKQSEISLHTVSCEDDSNEALLSIGTSAADDDDDDDDADDDDADDDDDEKNCNKCKYYRNDNCCGRATICDEYIGVSSVDLSDAPKVGDAIRYRSIYRKIKLENPYAGR